MSLPARIPDRGYYAGDRHEMLLRFWTLDAQGNRVPRDVSTATWEPTVRTSAGVGTYEVDAADAVNGEVRLILSEAQTRGLNTPMTRCDLREGTLWGRTILTWRLVRQEEA